MLETYMGDVGEKKTSYSIINTIDSKCLKAL